MFPGYPYVMRDSEDRNWTPGYGMSLKEHDLHDAYNSAQSRCHCGRTCHSEKAWNEHRVWELARSVLIDHAKDDKGNCFTCGKRTTLIPYSTHLLDALLKAGLKVVPDDGPA